MVIHGSFASCSSTASSSGLDLKLVAHCSQSDLGEVHR